MRSGLDLLHGQVNGELVAFVSGRKLRLIGLDDRVEDWRRECAEDPLQHSQACGRVRLRASMPPVMTAATTIDAVLVGTLASIADPLLL